MNGQLLSFSFCLIYLQVKQVMRNPFGRIFWFYGHENSKELMKLMFLPK